jgi:hypothetical protein
MVQIASLMVCGFLVALASPGHGFPLYLERNRRSAGPLLSRGKGQQDQEQEPVVVGAPASDVLWHVYIDQSKTALDKGGSATMDSFSVLAPASSVLVQAAVFNKGSATAGPSPVVRCISLQIPEQSFDVGGVDSVDKVYRVLTKHMKVKVNTLYFIFSSMSICLTLFS